MSERSCSFCSFSPAKFTSTPSLIISFVIFCSFETTSEAVIFELSTFADTVFKIFRFFLSIFSKSLNFSSSTISLNFTKVSSPTGTLKFKSSSMLSFKTLCV